MYQIVLVKAHRGVEDRIIQRGKSTKEDDERCWRTEPGWQGPNFFLTITVKTLAQCVFAKTNTSGSSHQPTVFWGNTTAFKPDRSVSQSSILDPSELLSSWLYAALGAPSVNKFMHSYRTAGNAFNWLPLRTKMLQVSLQRHARDQAICMTLLLPPAGIH